MKDAALEVSKYLPAAAASNNTDSIDLGRAGGADRGERAPIIVIEVNVPALPNHIDPTKTITLDLYSSADDAAFTEVAPLIQCKIAGVADGGAPAQTFSYPLPASVLQYIRWKQTVPAGAGDNTAGEITYTPVF